MNTIITSTAALESTTNTMMNYDYNHYTTDTPVSPAAAAAAARGRGRRGTASSPSRVRLRTNAYLSYESQFLAQTAAASRKLQKLYPPSSVKCSQNQNNNNHHINSRNSPPNTIQQLNSSVNQVNEEIFIKPGNSVQSHTLNNIEKLSSDLLSNDQISARPSYLDIIYPYITPEFINSNSLGNHSHTFTYFLSPLPFAIQRRKRKRCISEPKETPLWHHQQPQQPQPQQPQPQQPQYNNNKSEKENRVVWLDALGQPQGEMVYKDGVTLFYCETDSSPERSTYLEEFYGYLSN